MPNHQKHTYHLKLNALSYRKADSDYLFTPFDATYIQGFHGIVGDNGSGKSTLLNLIHGSLTPTNGTIEKPAHIEFYKQTPDTAQNLAQLCGLEDQFLLLEKAEHGLANAQELANINWDIEQIFYKAMRDANLSSLLPTTKANILSGGERTKARLATIFTKKPDLILLDEPTNNLDNDGKDYLLNALRACSSIVILVSHDQDLLNQVDTITEIANHKVQFFTLSFADFLHEQERMKQLLEDDYHQKRADFKKVKQEQHLMMMQQEKRNKKGKVNRKDAGNPKISLDRSKGRAERSTGKLQKRIQAQLHTHEENYLLASGKIKKNQPIDFSIVSPIIPAHKIILNAENLTGGHNHLIHNFNLTITGCERIALKGKNGSGKTTLFTLLNGDIPIIHGKLDIFVRFAMLDQHLSLLKPNMVLIENFQFINPQMDKNQCYAALARFGFRNGNAHNKISELSGGEKMRAGLACTIGAIPPTCLLLLDEPTNHLDFTATTVLKNALTDYKGAFIITSHDNSFLETLSITKSIVL